MSKHDTPTKPHRTPKVGAACRLHGITMAAVKQLAYEAKLRENQSPPEKICGWNRQLLILVVVIQF